MRMTLEHVQQRGNRKVYRRKVPKGLKEALGKGEVILPLGKTDAEVRKNYDGVHRKAQAILAAAWDEVRGAKDPAHGKGPSTQSAREKYDQTVAAIKKLGFNPFRDRAVWEEDEDIARDVTADEILDKYPRDGRTGHPIGIPESEFRLVRALYNGPGEVPPPSLDEAKRLYLDDRFAKSNPPPLARKKDEQRAARAIGHIVAALGKVQDITTIKRQQARTVQAHMLATINSPESVERYLNDIRAIINHAIKEFDLARFTNPFMGLAAAGGSRPRQPGKSASRSLRSS